MFAGLKNKIKEETGDDVNKISSLVSSGPSKTLAKGRHSRQGSTTSLGSFTIDGKDDGASALLDLKLADGRVITPKDFKKLESKEDEWRRKLQKKDEECSACIKKIEELCRKKGEEKDKEFLKLREKLEGEIKKVTAENIVLNSKIETLTEQVKVYEGYKNKICQYQEDLDQLEGFQTQEMAKVKHLLLEKEQNLIEKDKILAQNKKQIEDLSAEIRMLQASDRELQDSVDNLESLRHKSEQDKASLTAKLAAEEETTRHLKDRVAVLEVRCRAGCVGLGAELTIDERIQGLLGERALLERLLAEAHEHLSEVKTTWSGTITSLETQVGRLGRQASEESLERRTAETAKEELTRRLMETEMRLSAIEEEKCEKNQELEKVARERDDLKEEVELFRSKITSQSSQAAQEESDGKNKRISELEKSNSELTDALDRERGHCRQIEDEVGKLKSACESANERSAFVAADMARERREKDAMMMRNAEVSQEVELVRQELRAVQQEANDLGDRVNQLQAERKAKEMELLTERSGKEELFKRVQELEKTDEANSQLLKENSDYKESLINLEDQLLEKNKTVKSLQQRLSDMKKTLQRELKVPSRTIDPGGQNGEGFIQPHGPAVLTPLNGADEAGDVNFKYLKHVLFKFLTSREYEAQHLTRAVAKLLHFNAEEERLLRETMDWRNSWFGTRPKIGNAPMSRTIPPS